MRDWEGGKTQGAQGQRMPDLARTREGKGKSAIIPSVSKDERAESALPDRDTYVDLVKKAEADLALEEVPLSYREYLRRYFSAIRPPEEPAKEKPPGEDPREY